MNAPQRSGRLRPADHFVRSVAVYLAARRWNMSTDAALRRMYPSDEVVPIILRAASTPAVLGTSSWAGILAQTATQDFLATLGPMGGAGAALFRKGIQLRFGDNGALSVPSWLATASDSPFVTPDGNPIPVRQGTFALASLSPFKMASIMVYTNELFDHSIPNIESSIRQHLSEAIALDLDSVLFDANAATTVRPAFVKA
jgi:hypothetical protein